MKMTRSRTVKMSFLVRNLSPRKLNRGRVRWRTPISDVQQICVRLRPSCCIYRELNLGTGLVVFNEYLILVKIY